MEDCGTLSWILSDLWIVKSLPLDDNYIDDDYDDIDDDDIDDDYDDIEDVHDDIDDDDVIDEWGQKIFLGISCALLRLSAWIKKKNWTFILFWVLFINREYELPCPRLAIWYI